MCWMENLFFNILSLTIHICKEKDKNNVADSEYKEKIWKKGSNIDNNEKNNEQKKDVKFAWLTVYYADLYV